MKKYAVHLLAGTCAAALAVLLLAGSSHFPSPLIGRYLPGSSVHILLDSSGTPTILSDRTAGGLFDHLTAGDKILVLSSPATETYPARAGAYFCLRLADGSPDDLPAAALHLLEELGWISSPLL